MFKHIPSGPYLGRVEFNLWDGYQFINEKSKSPKGNGVELRFILSSEQDVWEMCDVVTGERIVSNETPGAWIQRVVGIRGISVIRYEVMKW